jgi:hypothetical protein
LQAKKEDGQACQSKLDHLHNPAPPIVNAIGRFTYLLPATECSEERRQQRWDGQKQCNQTDKQT